MLYGKGFYKTNKIPSGVRGIGRRTNLQHCAVDYNFTLGITIIIGL